MQNFHTFCIHSYCIHSLNTFNRHLWPNQTLQECQQSRQKIPELIDLDKNNRRFQHRQITQNLHQHKHVCKTLCIIFINAFQQSKNDTQNTSPI